MRKRTWNTLPYRTKLVITFVLLSILPLSFSYIYFSQQTYQHARSRVLEETDEALRRGFGELDALFYGCTQSLGILRQDYQI
jgi:hypothetical protein